MCSSATNCLKQCSVVQPSIHQVTNSIWVAEHAKDGYTHYCIFDDNQDKSLLSLVTDAKECLCMDKILTDPRSEQNLSSPLDFSMFLNSICEEMKLARSIDIKSIEHGMPCPHCTQIFISGEH